MNVVAIFNFAPPQLLLLLLLLLPALFWMVQFFIFMQMDDAAFPGKYDKLIWGIALIFMNLLAALVFREWRYHRARQQRQITARPPKRP